MKRILISFSIAAMITGLLMPGAVIAQKGDKVKEKANKEKTDLEQIIITHKGGKDDKVVLEFKDGKVIVNGKPADEFKNDDITVHSKTIRKDQKVYTINNNAGWNNNENIMTFNEDENRAMLGVTTEKADEGAEIQEVSKESAAEKAGLKVGDIITRVGDTKIEDADDLSKAVKSHKPGEKVTVTYLRDKKEQKVTTELGKWKGINFNFEGPEMNFNTPYAQTFPKMNMHGNGVFSYNSSPKLGLSVQDAEDGKGVKVIEVDDESNAAKAGIKEDDIITHVNDKEVNSADEIAKIVRENKEKPSIMIKLTRAGKTENIEVRIPRKLKTADL